MSPWVLLGVPAGSTDEEVRVAYLAKVKEFPPDREPEVFERIRDAYDKLRDPRQRAKMVLSCPEASAPLSNLVDEIKSKRKFAGPEIWRQALKNR